MDRILETLKKLVFAHGPPGLEDEVRDVILEEIMDSADEVTIDRLGNLIAVQHGSPEGPRVMLDAHMDEVALVVKYVDARGMIWFARSGGMIEKVLQGQHVTILSRKGHIPGVVGCKSGHLTSAEERARVTPLMGQWIDIGADSAEEVEEMGVKIGDPVTYEKRLIRLGRGDYVCATTLDDRVGCLVLIEILRRLREEAHEADVYSVFSVQEEVGCRGTQLAAHRIEPDIAFIVDTGFGEDPATNEKETRLKIGKGPAIRAWERRHIVLRRVFDFMVSTAEKKAIPYQTEIAIAGGTNASTIHLTKEGIPTGEVIVARRYSHSPIEVASLRDMENAVKLLTAIVKRLDSSFVAGFEKKIK